VVCAVEQDDEEVLLSLVVLCPWKLGQVESAETAALPWDWVAAFDAEHADDQRVGYIKAFLEEIGEHAFALGTVLASLASGEDYYLVFVTPSQFEELSRLFIAHGMSAESVRRCWEQSALIRAWARAQSPRVRTEPEAAIAGAKRAWAPEEAEPDPLA